MRLPCVSFRVDTAAVMHDLKSAGHEEPAAEAIARAILEADSDLATKSDIVAVKSDIAVVRSELLTRIIAAQVATALLLFAALRFLPS